MADQETELAYFQLCADEKYRLNYFLNVPEQTYEDGEESDEPQNGRQEKERALLMARLLKKNPRLIAEPIFTKEPDAKAEAVLKQYSIGHLMVDGDNRYLSADLLELMDESGQGRYCRHVHGVVAFVESNPDAVTSGVPESCRRLKSGFDGIRAEGGGDGVGFSDELAVCVVEELLSV